jgi:hypothetical protein
MFDVAHVRDAGKMNDDLSFIVRCGGLCHVPQDAKHLSGDGDSGAFLAADRGEAHHERIQFRRIGRSYAKGCLYHDHTQGRRALVGDGAEPDILAARPLPRNVTGEVRQVFGGSFRGDIVAYKYW